MLKDPISDALEEILERARGYQAGPLKGKLNSKIALVSVGDEKENDGESVGRSDEDEPTLSGMASEHKGSEEDEDEVSGDQVEKLLALLK